MNGFLNILKPPGMTSHDVVAYFRRLLKIRCIGHLGTLDPAAAGVIPVAVGAAATRIIEYIPFSGKRYRAEMQLGMISNTGDLEGEISAVAVTNEPDEDMMKSLLPLFTGTIMQTPPMASSIKVNGKKLYEYFRQKKDVDIPKRTVNIISLDMIKYSYPKMMIDVECSSGTYIRSLCADIGLKAGCGALMSFLVRTRSGVFDIKDSLIIDPDLDTIEKYQKKLIPPSEVLAGFVEIIVDKETEKKVINGLSFKIDWDLNSDCSSFVCIKNQKGSFIAVAQATRSEDHIEIKPKKVFIQAG